MFKDILGPDKNSDSSNYDDHGFSKDNKAKEAALGVSDHAFDCECDDCLEEAIKQLCDQMNIDLDDEELNDIKIEYYKDDDEDQVLKGNLAYAFKPKILLAMTRYFLRKVIEEEKGV